MVKDYPEGGDFSRLGWQGRVEYVGDIFKALFFARPRFEEVSMSEPHFEHEYSHYQETIKLIDLLEAEGLTEHAATISAVLATGEVGPKALPDLKPTIIQILHKGGISDLHVIGQAKKVLKHLTLSEMV
jgi:hypothetical protein